MRRRAAPTYGCLYAFPCFVTWLGQRRVVVRKVRCLALLYGRVGVGAYVRWQRWHWRACTNSACGGLNPWLDSLIHAHIYCNMFEVATPELLPSVGGGNGVDEVYVSAVRTILRTRLSAGEETHVPQDNL